MTRNMLVLSTAHLPPELGDLADVPGVAAWPIDRGALLWVPDDPADSDTMTDRVPVAVLDVQLFARAQGCDYVLLDADADPIDGLPVWSWE